MLNVTLNVYGLADIKEYINPDRINKELAQSVGRAVLQLHTTLAHSVFTRYNAPNDLNKALQRRSSLTETGKGFIKSGLEYKDTVTDLSNFTYTAVKGNLYEPKPRQGMVHTVKVIRGQAKKVHGKYRYGGFTQKVQGTNKIMMLERMQKATWYGKERAPVHRILALNLVDMATISIAHDTEVKAVLNNLENLIIDKFIP